MSTTQGFALDRETIARVDQTDQLTDILAIPEHLRDALWKVESAGLEPWDSPGGIIVAGGVRIGEGATVSGGAVIGEGVTIGAGNVLTRGVRVFPQTDLPSGAITF